MCVVIGFFFEGGGVILLMYFPNRKLAKDAEIDSEFELWMNLWQWHFETLYFFQHLHTCAVLCTADVLPSPKQTWWLSSQSHSGPVETVVCWPADTGSRFSWTGTWPRWSPRKTTWSLQSDHSGAPSWPPDGRGTSSCPANLLDQHIYNGTQCCKHVIILMSKEDTNWK